MLYLLVANALSVALSNAAHEKDIIGVPILETGEKYTHGQFVDDTTVSFKQNPFALRISLLFFER